MDDAVDDGYGDVVIDKKLAPVGEFLVGGQDHRAVLFVQRVDELKQVVHALFVYRQVTQFVDDEHIEFEQLVDFLFQLAFEFGKFQGLHQAQCSVKADLITGIDGVQADANGQVCLADPGWPDEDDVVPIVDKAEIEQTVDYPFTDGGLKAIIELFQAFEQRKAIAFAVLLDALGVALALFMFNQAFGKLQGGTFMGLGFAKQGRQVLGKVPKGVRLN